jgi:hypothetical protein
MQAVVLARWDLVRLLRHRWAWITLAALPIVLTTLRCAAPGWHPTLICAWACPFLCLAMVSGIIWMRAILDTSNGLSAGIATTRITDRQVVVSHLISGGVLFALQMMVFCVPLILRF